MERLIDTNGSLVLIVRQYLPPDLASQICDRLRLELPWRQEQYKDIDIPRRMCSCGDPGLTEYRYSTISLPMEPWIPEVKALRDRIQAETGIPFDSCLLNEYKDGRSSISAHSDREALGPNNEVVTVSLGGSRPFYFKTKTKPYQKIKTILHNGDLVIMSGNTQRDYTHEIPKVETAEYRISLTFRLIKP
jgi:alkylated DNA repair dioxygenase AlkB